MASTDAILVGVYGIGRGLYNVFWSSLLIFLGGVLSSFGYEGFGGIAVVFGLVSLIAGIALVVVAIGLFVEKSWAPLGAFVVFAVLVVISVFQLIQGSSLGLLSVVFLLLDGVGAGWAALNAPEISLGSASGISLTG